MVCKQAGTVIATLGVISPDGWIIFKVRNWSYQEYIIIKISIIISVGYTEACFFPLLKYKMILQKKYKTSGLNSKQLSF